MSDLSPLCAPSGLRPRITNLRVHKPSYGDEWSGRGAVTNAARRTRGYAISGDRWPDDVRLAYPIHMCKCALASYGYGRALIVGLVAGADGA
jgi:hypothetical protein